MPAQSRRDLYLQVNGNVDNLTAATKAARTAMLGLGSDATTLVQDVEQAFGNIRGDGLQDSLKAIDANVKATISGIRQNLMQAASAPNGATAGMILNLSGAREAAAAAEQEAATLKTLALAAQEAAAKLGETGMAERELAVGFAATAAQRAQYAAGLRAQATALENVAAEAGIASHANDNLGGSHQRMGIAGMEAEHVVRALSDSIAAGQSPIRAVTMEMGRITEAMTFLAQQSGSTEGKFAKFAAFMGGPYGLAISVGVAVLTPLVAKLLEGGNAAEEEAEKLKKNAGDAAMADRAKAAFALTEDGAIDSVRRLTQELDKQNEALKTNAERQNELARRGLATEQGKRPAAAQELTAAEAALGDARARASTIGQYGAHDSADLGALQAVSAAEARVAAAKAELAKIDSAIAQARTAVSRTNADLAGEAAKRDADPAAAIKYRYEGYNGLIETAKRRATAEERVNGVLERRLALLNEQEAKETKAAQAAERPKKSGLADENNLGNMEATLRALLPGVRITSTTSGQHVAGSDHYAGRAIDFVPAGGMGSVSYDAMLKMLEDAGVHIRRNASGTLQFFGPGHGPGGANDHSHDNHFHVAWTGSTSPEEATRRAQAQQDKATRDAEVFDQLESRAREENLQLQRAQVSDIGQAADLDADRVEEERKRLNSAAQARADEAKSYDQQAQARADAIIALNDQNAELKKQAIRQKALSDMLTEQTRSQHQVLSQQIATLQMKSGLSNSRVDQRSYAMQILGLQERDEKLKARDEVGKATDLDTWLDARGRYDQVDRDHPLRVAQVNKQYHDPLANYGDQLHQHVDDMNDALKGVAADGLKGVEDGLTGLISGTETVAQAFKRMADAIISDLVRIAVEKLILSVFGLKDGGKVDGFASGGLPGFAEGGQPYVDRGIIRGPGTGRSDSILAVVGGRKPIFLSNGESINTAESTRRNWPIIDAMNKGMLPGFADGGLLGRDMSGLGYPALPTAQAVARPAPPPQVIYVQIDKSQLFDAHVTRIAAPMAQAAMIGGAAQAQQDMADERVASIPV